MSRTCALLLVFCLAACGSPIGQPVLEQRVVAATLEGWEAQGLPEPTGRCELDRFAVEHPDALEFNRLCYPHTVETAWACFRWRLVEHRFMALYSETYPAAIIRPGADLETEGLAVHELCHALIDCTGLRSDFDPYDFDHTDPRIWTVGGPSSVEAFAQHQLR